MSAIIFMGLRGSGKSTFCETLKNHGWHYFDKNVYLLSNSSILDGLELEIQKMINEKKFKITLDRPFRTIEDYYKIVKILCKYNFNVINISLIVDLSLISKRLIERNNKKPIKFEEELLVISEIKKQTIMYNCNNNTKNDFNVILNFILEKF